MSTFVSSSSTTTQVVRIKRKNNSIIQDCDIYIGRKCEQGGWKLPQSKWHNPYTITNSGSREQAIEKFEKYLLSNPQLMKELPELKGKTLGCWCYPEACHGNILVKLVNALP